MDKNMYSGIMPFHKSALLNYYGIGQNKGRRYETTNGNYGSLLNTGLIYQRHEAGYYGISCNFSEHLWQSGMPQNTSFNTVLDKKWVTDH